MFTVTATARGTQGLTITPTQNTAPVHEFRCMFSHDVRKKQKKWHDGSLRFHTFNKRVMVYDEVKNFIGDLHYRDDDEFGEGTELQLDKGVLVQVEDRIGQSETDLAPLLDRRRPEDDSGSHRAPARARSTLPRPSMLSTERPKSLTAVLGLSQGPIGRVRLNNRSPFERLQATTSKHADEPIPKRRRISSDKENQDGQRPARPTASRRQFEVRRASTNSDSSLKINKAARVEATRNQIIAISPSPPSADPCVTPTASEMRARVKGAGTNAHSRQRANDKGCRSPRSGQGKQQKKGTSDSANGSILSNAAAFVQSVGQWDRQSLKGKSPLLFPPLLPRKKLLYNASANKRLRQSDNSISRVTSGEAPTSRARSTDQQSHVATSKSTETVAKNNADGHRSRTSSSPLFVSPAPENHSTQQTDLRQSSTSPLRPASKAPEISRSLSGATPTSVRHVVSPVTPRFQHNASEDQQDAIDEPMTRQSPAASILPQRLVPSPQPKALRRVLSENDSRSQQPPVSDTHSLNITAADSLGLTNNTIDNVVHPVAQANQSSRRMQRSISDISPLRPADNVPVTVDQETSGAETVPAGPWTEVEAYLLFEWWPPDRRKPAYGTPMAQMRVETDGLDGRGRFIDEVHVP